MNSEIFFYKISDDDLEFITGIFNYYIEKTVIAFYTKPVSVEEISKVIPFSHPVYAAYIIKWNGNKCGYCYYSQYKAREAYNRTAEITVYLSEEFTGKGIGKAAVEFIEQKANEKNIKNLIATITALNQKSIKLFEKCGYKKCAHLKNVGEKFDQILDVVMYQKEI